MIGQGSGQALHLLHILTLQLNSHGEVIGIGSGSLSIDSLIGIYTVTGSHVAQSVEETVRHRKQGVLQSGILEHAVDVHILAIHRQGVRAKVMIQSILHCGSQTGQLIVGKGALSSLNGIHIQSQGVSAVTAGSSHNRSTTVAGNTSQSTVQLSPGSVYCLLGSSVFPDCGNCNIAAYGNSCVHGILGLAHLPCLELLVGRCSKGALRQVVSSTVGHGKAVHGAAAAVTIKGNCVRSNAAAATRTSARRRLGSCSSFAGFYSTLVSSNRLGAVVHHTGSNGCDFHITGTFSSHKLIHGTLAGHGGAFGLSGQDRHAGILIHRNRSVCGLGADHQVLYLGIASHIQPDRRSRQGDSTGNGSILQRHSTLGSTLCNHQIAHFAGNSHATGNHQDQTVLIFYLYGGARLIGIAGNSLVQQSYDAGTVDVGQRQQGIVACSGHIAGVQQGIHQALSPVRHLNHVCQLRAGSTCGFNT